MDLIKAIRTFITVNEQGSFSATADKLNIAVSAVSRHVSELEQYFNCQLLHRTTRTMQLSDEGKVLLVQLTDVISRLDELQQNTQQNAKKVMGKITLSTPFHSEGLGMSDIVCEFNNVYPDVEVCWLMHNRYVNLIDEGVDLAIRVGKLADSNLIARKYGNLDVVFIASPDYLALHGIPESLDELGKHRCIVEYNDSGVSRWRYLDNGKEKYPVIKGKLAVNKPNMVAKLCVQSKGIAQLPKYMVQQYLDSGELVTIWEKYTPEPLELHIVYSSSKHIKPAVKEFIDFFLTQTDQKIV